VTEGTNVIYVENNIVSSVFQSGLYIECIIKFQCTPLYRLFQNTLLTIRDGNLSSWAVSRDGMTRRNVPQKKHNFDTNSDVKAGVAA